jgi:hypothetical protein
MQKLRPREVDILAYPNAAHMTIGASLIEVETIIIIYITVSLLLLYLCYSCVFLLRIIIIYIHFHSAHKIWITYIVTGCVEPIEYLTRFLPKSFYG